jgi:small-conductance mechanosensitive channel
MNWLDSLSFVSYAGNSLRDYALAAVYFVLWLAGLGLAQRFIVRRLAKLAAKTAGDFDDAIVGVFTRLKPPFYVLVAFFLAIQPLSLPPLAAKVVKVAFVTVVIYEVIRAFGEITDYLLEKRFAASAGGDPAEGEQARTAAHAIRLFVQIVLWGVGLVVALGNLGINVNSLIASLGIGGIAVALAAQNVLGDLFSSFTIFSDKPFHIGDLVQIGADTGTVEKIGLKSTRVRTQQGEMLVLPNREVASSRIRNFREMKRRRVVIQFGLEYGLPAAKLRRATETVKATVAAAGASFDRCHFLDYGDSALVFEIAYYVETGDYLAYMDIREKVNLGIYEAFEREGLPFAFPTQTVHLKQ